MEIFDKVFHDSPLQRPGYIEMKKNLNFILFSKDKMKENNIIPKGSIDNNQMPE
jgi:hypothetical protein